MPWLKVSALNESPSEKEGKYPTHSVVARRMRRPSMKVPPKRKGNHRSTRALRCCLQAPQ